MIALGLDSTQDLATVLLENLASVGFAFNGNGEIQHAGDVSKERVRSLHAQQRADVFRRNAEFVDKYLDDVAPFFCSGKDVDVLKIEPFLRPVVTDVDAALFRAATMLWSVPVSQGYGRRTRFLVCDRQNGALMGIMALGDPVFNLSVRDRLIGWDVRDREHRLYQCFDAFVLGAVPPYRELLGGKLIALCAISNETRRYLEKKYFNAKTVIRKERKISTPVLVSTTSSLGRSSIYSRLKMGSRTLYYPVGYTEGFGHFHFSDELYAAFVSLLDRNGNLPSSSYGKGPNYRMRVTRRALATLGLNQDLLRHGIRREVFLAPVAHNWREILRGEETEVDKLDLPLSDLGSFWVSRWAFPRSMRDDSYRAVTGSGTLSLIRPGATTTQSLLGDQYTRNIFLAD